MGTPEVKDLWIRLQLYALVLLSLALDYVLIAIGYLVKNRKGKTWVASLTSLSYFFGDFVATSALITLLKGQLNGKKDALQFFWAPFLLLHLGSAETIAAHFLEEKKLWQRYTLGLIIQSAMACYILTRFERGNVLTYIAIPIFVAGVLKCMERIWILRSSGFRQFVNSSMLETPTKKPGTGRSKGLEPMRLEMLDDHLIQKSIIPEGRHLHRAMLSFQMFVPVFADIEFRIYKGLSDIFKLKESMSAEEAFQMVATELEFLYDALYTKTAILNISLGFTFRIIYFLSSTGALLAFCIAYISNQHDHSKGEIYITYFLLCGACFADGIAIISHVLSNWTLVWFTNPDTWRRLPICLRSLVTSCLKLKKMQEVKYMAQHNLLTDCLVTKGNKFNAVISRVTKHVWEDVSPTTWAPVDADVKDLIFFRLQQKRKKYEEQKFSNLSDFEKNGASLMLKDHGEVLEDIEWSIDKVEFAYSLLVWHIATDILFHHYEIRYPSCTRGRCLRVSKKLSDYMMHLLVKRSSMLRSGIGKLRYRDTCFDAVNFFGRHGVKMESKDLGKAAVTLLFLEFECRLLLFWEEGEGGNKSVFFEGCKLARQLQQLVQASRWDTEELWEMISSVWMEMLFIAAYDCDWKNHMYQLGHGGELLTHVGLLMAHLGLTKHLRITDAPEEYEQYNVIPPWDWNNLGQMAHYLA